MTYRVLLIGMEEVQENLKGLNVKIDRTTWEYLTPLNRYDMIIVDNTSTTPRTVKIAIKAKNEIQKFVEDGGILVCLCCRPKSYGGYKSYGWLNPLLPKVKVVVRENSGLKIKKSMLEKFFHRQKDNINVECYFHNIRDIGAEVIATTGLEEVIAFSMDLGGGKIICLPQFKNKDSFLENWLEVWVSKKPDWVEKYEYKEKKGLLKKLSSINVLEKLLYGNDRELCKAVAEAFKIMGFEVKMGGMGTEPDIYLHHDHFAGIVEVKGLKTHADRDDMRELLDYYDANVNKQPGLKGIFVVNHYREVEPEKKEKPFTNGALELAQIKNFCLITTTDLYFAVEKALNDSSLREVLRTKIISGVGLIKLTKNSFDL